MDGSVAASADSLDETGAGSCGLAGIGGSKGGMKTAAGAGSVAGLLRGAGDGAGGSWIAECVMHLVGGSSSLSLLLFKNSVVAGSLGGRVDSLGEIYPSSLIRSPSSLAVFIPRYCRAEVSKPSLPKSMSRSLDVG